MFVRKVTVPLKSNVLKQFVQLMESEILPWLRAQEGFLDLITLAATRESEIQALSFWDHEGNAQAFNPSGYTTVLESLAALLDGVPQLKTFEVVTSTLKGFGPLRPEEGMAVAQLGSKKLRGGSQEANV